MTNCSYPLRTRATRNKCRGYGFILMLVVVAILGVTLSAAAEMYRTTAVRDKERQLLFAGHEFREAIRRYSEASPAGQARYPRSLEDLLRDPRSPTLKRHLRRVYLDPMTGTPEWGLLIVDGGIAGVHSMSQKEPFKVANFEPNDASFTDAPRYADWVFSHPPDLVVKQDHVPQKPAAGQQSREAQ